MSASPITSLRPLACRRDCPTKSGMTTRCARESPIAPDAGNSRRRYLETLVKSEDARDTAEVVYGSEAHVRDGNYSLRISK